MNSRLTDISRSIESCSSGLFLNDKVLCFGKTDGSPHFFLDCLYRAAAFLFASVHTFHVASFLLSFLLRPTGEKASGFLPLWNFCSTKTPLAFKVPKVL